MAALRASSFFRPRLCAFTRSTSNLRDVLALVKAGTLSLDDAEDAIGSRNASKSLLGMTETVENYARIDHGRALRTGLPEVVFGEGKSVEHLSGCLQAMHREALRLPASPKQRRSIIGMATRVSPTVFEQIKDDLPYVQYYPAARIAALRHTGFETPTGLPMGPEDVVAGERKGENATHDVAVLCAGTSDFPVAEEAAVTLELFGFKVARLYDVGVAGLHRLLAQAPVFRRAKVKLSAQAPVFRRAKI